MKQLIQQKSFFNNNKIDNRDLLVYLKKWLIQNETLIFDALAKDLGRTSFETYEVEIMPILSEINFLLKHGPKTIKVRTPIMHTLSKSRIYREAYGQVLIIAPWNYPLQLSLLPLLSALACQNVVVLKPSEEAVHTSTLLRDLFSDPIFKDRVVVFEGGKEISNQLLDYPFDKIFFTGSSRVGKIVMEKASKHLTPVILELGGKSPCVVDESANLKLAARRIVWGKFVNAGQTCIAPDTLYVHESIKIEFKEYLIDEIKKQWSTDMGCIINEKHYARLLSYCDSETLILGSDDASRKYLAPRITENYIEDEIFGPIISMITYTDSANLISTLRDLPKPLSFYLFTTKNHDLMNSLSFGGGVINDCLIHFANSNLPFGGIGNSGMGSYHGHFGIDAFSHKKSVLEKSNLFDIKVRYAPYKNKISILRRFSRK